MQTATWTAAMMRRALRQSNVEMSQARTTTMTPLAPAPTAIIAMARPRRRRNQRATATMPTGPAAALIPIAMMTTEP